MFALWSLVPYVVLRSADKRRARVSERLSGADKQNSGYARSTESPRSMDVVAGDVEDEIAVRR